MAALPPHALIGGNLACRPEKFATFASSRLSRIALPRAVAFSRDQDPRQTQLLASFANSGAQKQRVARPRCERRRRCGTTHAPVILEDLHVAQLMYDAT